MGGIIEEVTDYFVAPFGSGSAGDSGEATDQALDPFGATSTIDAAVTSTTGVELGSTDIVPGIKDEDRVVTDYQINTALTPEPRVAPTEIPLPEEPVKKRRRAAKGKQGRRGRDSTILTALNNEPLGGG